MANYLCLGSTAEPMRLSSMEKPDLVVSKLDEARRNHDVAHVDIVLQDGYEPQLVSIDPSHYGWWAVLNTPEPDERS